jgi:hypothetical protein
MSDGIADKVKIDGGINLTHQIVCRYQLIKVMVSNWYCWGEGSLEHGSQSIFCTDLIRSTSWL